MALTSSLEENPAPAVPTVAPVRLPPDMSLAEIDSELIYFVGGAWNYKYGELCVAKVIATAHSTPIVKHEWKMMNMAGNCSIKPIGRIFSADGLVGIYMPCARPLDQLLPTLTRTERIRIIVELVSLLDQLHTKNIIHGDIKPPNILICSDGMLRFCDFATSSVDGDGHIAQAFSDRYSSPYRLRSAGEKPLTKREDTYSLGVTCGKFSQESGLLTSLRRAPYFLPSKPDFVPTSPPIR
jgi:serine/threonine protein kinase